MVRPSMVTIVQKRMATRMIIGAQREIITPTLVNQALTILPQVVHIMDMDLDGAVMVMADIDLTVSNY